MIFNRKTTAHALKKIDLRKYIDQIQETIALTSKEIGIGTTKQQRKRGMARLDKKIRWMSTSCLAVELGMMGDYNITYLMMKSMICCAWSTFIIKAKSLDKRRPKEDRQIMARMVADMEGAFSEIIRQAVNYGKIYDKEKEV